jgi:hypothetical protein
MSTIAIAPTTQVRLWQKLVAGAGSLLSAYELYEVARGDAGKVALAIFAVVLAAGLVHLPALGPQLVARAVWWANLGLGTAFSVFGGRSEREIGLLIALGCGTALLVIGRKGLAEASERAGYAPAAFRSSLMLLMALGLADAQTFALFAILALSQHNRAGMGGPGVLLAVVASLFVIGFIGLYRFWLWGALVNVGTAALFFLVVATDAVHYTRELSQLFMVVCAGQVLAATPMMIGLVRGRPLPSPPARVRGLGAVAAVVVLMLVCVYRAVS